jgi:2-amino-4-hydroxy-6-hydroxymethyldihydropteridine diphosphokinase
VTRAFVGLGSNIERPVQQLDSALVALGRLRSTRLLNRSSRFWTEPVGDPDQPEFLNAVVALETGLDAHALLAGMQTIERNQDRRRDANRPFGPRTLDLDLLIYGDESIETPELTVPHPRLHQRAFVLCPLAELAPDLFVPGRGPVGELLSRVEVGGVRLAESERRP